MSLPTLTPTSTTSAIVLPETGSASNVVSALPLGVYATSQEFLTGAAAQVAFTYKRSGPLLALQRHLLITKEK